MLPAPDVVTLTVPAHVARRPELAANEAVFATAQRAWQLQFELAWSYPRLCYAVWSRLMTLGQ